MGIWHTTVCRHVAACCFLRRVGGRRLRPARLARYSFCVASLLRRNYICFGCVRILRIAVESVCLALGRASTMLVFGGLSASYLLVIASLILLGEAAFAMAAVSSCPTCFGNLAGCTFSTNGKCPARTALDENIATAAAAAVATTVAAGTVLKLKDLVSLRFLRMFTASSLSLHSSNASLTNTLFTRH